MWQWILLFIVLTPGVLFTIPPYGKKFVKGVSGKVVTAVLHGLVFVAAAWFFMLCKEGFQEYTAPCSPGSGSIDGTTASCVACPAGSFSEHGDYCDTCPVHTYSNSVGATSCTPCAPGTYSGPGSTTCKSAGSDTVVATRCPSGNYLTADLLSLYYPVCRPCSAGNYSKGGTATRCTRCPNGTISASSGANVCTACPAGQVTNAQRTACMTERVTCAAGSGVTMTGSTWNTTCKTCPAGTYSALNPQGGSWTTTRRCEPCDSTTPYSNAGAKSLKECRATR